MKTFLTILACAITYTIVSIGVNFITGDPITGKSVVHGVISGLVFSVIFVPIILRSRKKNI